jgi:uncharacterized protein with HEPN domain
MKPDERVYLCHILDAITKAESYLRGLDEPAFGGNSLVQDAVIRQLEIVGEAARHISPAFRRSHSQVPWDDIAGMRDKLIHDYFGVDLGRVWLTATEDLPILKTEVQAILADFETRRPPDKA